MSEKDEITIFAKTNFRNREVPFGIKADDRRRHMYVIGKTGMGKTTLMENMVIQDIRNGHGVAFLDPHGDSVQKILNCIPASRINDVIYFNPADLEYPIAFNILEAVDARYKHLVASGLMGVFTKIWANLWSARMEYILNNTILALLESPGNTMLGITRMYIDKKYRKKIIDNVKDPMVRAFWVDEFANYNEKYRTEAIAPIQNKVGQFLSSGIIRNIVGQPRSTIDLRELMDQRKILIMDLSKGKVGEDNSALLGAMLVTKLQLAAMSRTDIPEAERKDFYLYVDEFQNFATESFATILSEARKYRLNLTVGHQYIAQLEQDKNTKVRDAIFGNVGTMIFFRVGAADAEYVETEFEPTFTPNDLVNLPKYNIILKLMINGVASEPFSATTLAPNPEWYTGNAEKVIKVSRERYANPVAEVEEKISRWMGAEFHQEAAIMIGAGQDADKEMEAPEPVSKAQAEPLPLIINTAPAIPVPAPIPAPVPLTQTSQQTTPIEQPAWELPKPPVMPLSRAPQEFLLEAAEPEIRKQEPAAAASIILQTHQERPRPEHRHHDSRPRDRHQPHHDRHGGRDHHPHRESHRSNVHHHASEKKQENPIWQTVATLRTEKKKEEEEKVGAVVKQLFKAPVKSRAESDSRHEPREPLAAQPPSSEKKDGNDPVVQERHAASQGNSEHADRKIIRPGQAVKF